MRRNFVPAPNYAEAFLGRATPLELPLLDSLGRELRRMTGVTIDREAWQWDQVPDHLKITFRVVDEKNKKLQDFYATTARLLLDEQRIGQLIQKRSYQTLAECLEAVDNERTE